MMAALSSSIFSYSVSLCLVAIVILSERGISQIRLFNKPQGSIEENLTAKISACSRSLVLRLSVIKPVVYLLGDDCQAEETEAQVVIEITDFHSHPPGVPSYDFITSEHPLFRRGKHPHHLPVGGSSWLTQ